MIPEEWLKYAPKPAPLINGNEWNVFLSYRSVNRTWVLNLYDILTELGFKAFIDQFELTPGDELIARLGNALKKSQAGVLIWSNAAADSAWVEHEYEKLETKATNSPAFKFVPVRLDNAELPGFADNRIFIDFSSYPDGPNGGELLRLVYGIVGKTMSWEAVKFADQQNEIAAEAADEISAAILNKKPQEITKLFQNGGLPWHTTPALGCKAAESLAKLGCYKEAIQILEQIEEKFPKSLRPKQLHALALARRGENDDLDQAQKILARLYVKGTGDPETLGIYARTWMDRYKISKEKEDLRQSRNYYASAFSRTADDYYTGINAASKSVFLGDLDMGNDYAGQVEKIVGTKAVEGDYWKTATIAEAMLIKKKFKEAAEMYQKAIDIAPNEKGSIQSTKAQAMLLIEHLGGTAEENEMIKNVFK